MKKINEKKKKLIINILLILGVLIVTSILSIIILNAFNILSFHGNGITFNEKYFEAFKNSWYGWLIFVLAQTILTILLSAVPGVSMALILVCITLYGSTFQAFSISFASILLSSAAMYGLGRWGGYRFCVRVLGKEDCDKSLELLNRKGIVYFPLMMMFPLFPDDALVMLAGTIKMKLKYFIPSIIFARGIGLASIVFGVTLVPFNEFDHIYDWLVFLTVCIFWLNIIFNIAKRIDKKIMESEAKNEQV